MTLRELVSYALNPSITIPENLAENEVIFTKQFSRTDLKDYLNSPNFIRHMSFVAKEIKMSMNFSDYEYSDFFFYIVEDISGNSLKLKTDLTVFKGTYAYT